MPSHPCPRLEALQRHVAGTADDDGVAAHLETCADCTQVCDQLRDDNALLAEFARAHCDATAKTPPFTGSIPGYRIIEDIGAGGQGVVYQAVQLATRRTVAVKVLLGGGFAELRRRERFEREIEVVASLNHPNIVTVFDSGSTPDGRRYYAMEYVAGKPLLEFVCGGPAARRRDIRERLVLFAKISDAISAAHLRGIVHRDLKPANLLVDATGEPHILDFGLAKVLHDGPLAGGATPTVSGEFMGTFQYAAPEQLRGRPELIDIRADVYALGVVLYELLADRPPYVLGESIGDAIRTIVETSPPRPSTLRAGLDDELDTIALKALAKEPLRRYQSAGDLARDVQRYLAGEPIDAKRDSTWYLLRKAARRHRAVVLAAGAAALLLLAFAVSMAVLARRVELQRQRADETARGLVRTLSEANIERGRLMTEMGNIVVAEQLLWREYLTHAAESPLGRQAYWALWELYSRQPCVATLPARFYREVGLEWDGGAKLVGVDRIGHVEAWDIASLTQTASVRLEGCADWGPPRINLAAGLALNVADGQLLIWQLATGQLRLSLPTWTLPVGSLPAVFSPDGASVVCPYDAERLARYDTSDGRLVATSNPDPALLRDMRFIAFMPDGTHVITENRAEQVGSWDVQGGEFRRIWESTFPSAYDLLSVASDASRIAVCGTADNYAFRILDGRDGNCICQASWSGGRANSLTFSPDGSEVACATGDRIIRLWEASACQLGAELLGSAATLSALRYRPSGRLLASGASDGTVKLWDIHPAATVRFAPSNGTLTVSALAFSPDGGDLLTSFGDPGCLAAHDPRSGGLRRVYPGDMATITAIACSPDGALIAAASMDGTIRIWDRLTARAVCTFREPAGKRAHNVAFHPGGQLVASSHDDGVVRLWSLPQRACIAEFAGQTGRVPSVCIAPDGKRLAAAGTGGRVIVWDTETRAVLHELASTAVIERTVAFSPDGCTLVTGGDDGMLKLWDVATGLRRATLAAHQHDVFTAAYSPDGHLIASGDRGGVIMLWDSQTGRNLAKIVHHTDMVFGVAFSPDSRYLASGSRDAQAIVLDLPYFARHIAGNLEYQLSHLDAAAGNDAGTLELTRRRSWAQDVWTQCWTQ